MQLVNWEHNSVKRVKTQFHHSKSWKVKLSPHRLLGVRGFRDFSPRNCRKMCHFQQILMRHLQNQNKHFLTKCDWTNKSFEFYLKKCNLFLKTKTDCQLLLKSWTLFKFIWHAHGTWQIRDSRNLLTPNSPGGTALTSTVALTFTIFSGWQGVWRYEVNP